MQITPFISAQFPGVGGMLRQNPSDFSVEEIPPYEPVGEGEHVYCQIEKTGITTFEAIDRMARQLNVHPRDIGYAGMKDANAITRQIFSIYGSTPEAVRALTIPDISVRWVDRHRNKLRLGHLAGNRFDIKIREVTPTDVVKLSPIVEILNKRGMPNYFGEQRFGRRGDNHLLGAALIANDAERVLKHLLGTPVSELDDAQQRAARQAFDRGDLETSMKRWPRNSGMERRVLARLIKTKSPAAALRIVDERVQRIWVSALQSEMFNQTLAVRIDSIDKLWAGDLAQRHDSGGVFLVEDEKLEQPRCDAFEISPTGPLVGYRMTMPTGKPLEIEEEILRAHGLKPGDFKQSGRHRVKGTRRPLRVKPENLELSAGADEFGPYIAANFTLPPGSFATVLMNELMKQS